MTKANRGQIRDIAGGCRCQPYPAFSLAAELGWNGDDDGVRRSLGRYLFWRHERQRHLAEAARKRRFPARFFAKRLAVGRVDPIVLAWQAHRRVCHYAAQAREAQREYERRKQMEEMTT